MTRAHLGRRLLTAAAAAALTSGARRWLAVGAPGGAQRWERRNFRGEPVTLLAGPAVAAGLAGATLLDGDAAPSGRRAAALVVAVTAGIGAYDDFHGAPATKGLRGHLGAVGRGDLTSGVAKVGVIGLTALAAAPRLAPGRGFPGNLLDGASIAGCANLANLFDLRPGRTLKVALLATPAVLLPSGALLAPILGACIAVLRDDLAERSMLGDCGANAIGASLGCALVADGGRVTRAAVLTSVLGLTVASEKVSFTTVIERTRGLAWLDGLGRRGAG